MRRLLSCRSSAWRSTRLRASAAATVPSRGRGPRRVVLDNARVRVYRDHGRTSSTGVDHGPASSCRLDGWRRAESGDAFWVDDAAAPPSRRDGEGLRSSSSSRIGAPALPPPPSGIEAGRCAVHRHELRHRSSRTTRVSVIRARMEVGAREGLSHARLGHHRRPPVGRRDRGHRERQDDGESLEARRRRVRSARVEPLGTQRRPRRRRRASSR